MYSSFVRSERRASYVRSLRDSQESGWSAPFQTFMAEETIEILLQKTSEYTRDIERDVPWA